MNNFTKFNLYLKLFSNNNYNNNNNKYFIMDNITSAIKIQSYFHQKKLENKFNIYLKLPIEIQQLIKYQIHKNYYIKKQNQIISKIILKKVNNFTDKLKLEIGNEILFVSSSYIIFNYLSNNINNCSYINIMKEFKYIIYLLDKYFSIINFSQKHKKIFKYLYIFITDRYQYLIESRNVTPEDKFSEKIIFKIISYYYVPQY